MGKVQCGSNAVVDSLDRHPREEKEVVSASEDKANSTAVWKGGSVDARQQGSNVTVNNMVRMQVLLHHGREAGRKQSNMEATQWSTHFAEIHCKRRNARCQCKQQAMQEKKDKMCTKQQSNHKNRSNLNTVFDSLD